MMEKIWVLAYFRLTEMFCVVVCSTVMFSWRQSCSKRVVLEYEVREGGEARRTYQLFLDFLQCVVDIH